MYWSSSASSSEENVERHEESEVVNLTIQPRRSSNVPDVYITTGYIRAASDVRCVFQVCDL